MDIHRKQINPIFRSSSKPSAAAMLEAAVPQFRASLPASAPESFAGCARPGRWLSPPGQQWHLRERAGTAPAPLPPRRDAASGTAGPLCGRAHTSAACPLPWSGDKWRTFCHIPTEDHLLLRGSLGTSVAALHELLLGCWGFIKIYLVCQKFTSVGSGTWFKKKKSECYATKYEAPPKEEVIVAATEQSQNIKVWFDSGDMQRLRTDGITSSTSASIMSPTKTASFQLAAHRQGEFGSNAWEPIVVPVFLQSNEILDLWSVSKQAVQKETHCFLILGRTSWQRPKYNWLTAARLQQYGLYSSPHFICSSFVHFSILLRMRNQI